MPQVRQASYACDTSPRAVAHPPPLEAPSIKQIALALCLFAGTIPASSSAGSRVDPVAISPGTATLDPGSLERPSASVVGRGPEEETRVSASPVFSERPAAPDAQPSSATEVFGSYYGPGLYGRRTACGQALTPGLLGVAHRGLPCGSLVTLRHGSATVTVPVVDRGPYVLSREFDLTFATRDALGCPDLCRLSWLQ